MAEEPTLRKWEIAIAALWNFVVGVVCTLFARMLLDNKISTSPLVKWLSIAVFTGLTLMSMARWRRRSREFFRK